eukprot:4116372-Pyramimonas_sp.AAC.1
MRPGPSLGMRGGRRAWRRACYCRGRWRWSRPKRLPRAPPPPSSPARKVNSHPEEVNRRWSRPERLPRAPPPPSSPAREVNSHPEAVSYTHLTLPTILLA